MVLVMSGPTLGTLFAARLVGLRLPKVHSTLAIDRLTKEDLAAMQLTAKEAVRRHASEPRPSQCNTPTPSRGTWREVLGLPLNEHRRSVAHKAYRALAHASHPDLNGSNEAMQVVNDAWRQARRELVLR